MYKFQSFMFIHISIPVTGRLPTCEMHIYQYKKLICKYKITVDINPRLVLLYFNVTGCELSSTGIGSDQPSVVNSIQEGPTGIAVVKISRTELSANAPHDIVDHIRQKTHFTTRNQ